MNRIGSIASFVLFVAATVASAQERTATARRIAGESPEIDGRLTEAIWSVGESVTGFTQREPNEGLPAIENTEVRFAYDDDALYVGARMYSDNPADIRALITRRDVEGISEFIGVSFDTYHDRRTAYSFAVTPAGVRLDFYHASDNEHGDEGYDPVWEARARIDSIGWTAEMRIPFNQLRFSPRDVQVWGLNVVRRVPVRNEDSYWMLIRRQETGWASRMGTLTGIRGIRPSRRLEVLPYLAANSRVADVIDRADPFQQRTESAARLGGDLKMGLGPNLTLDVTLNPDFGQVEADPAEVNLSAYETFFDERRPFFTEGSDLFERRDLFYSRRIGAPPPGNAAGDFAEERANSTILGAAKLTGRLPSGLSVAALGAVTDREVVRTFDAGTQLFGSSVVAPLTAYAVASAQQEFGRGRDASTLGGMVTFVQRDLKGGTQLADLLPRTAVSGIVDGRRRWAEGTYDMNFWAAFTDVRGDSAAILRQQLSSRRYWQRPDAPHVSVDPTRRQLSGTILGLGHSKMAGKHWLWDIDYFQESPGFEPNDIGAFGAVDNRSLSADLTWRETRPGSWYRDYSFGTRLSQRWNYFWMQREREMNASANLTLANYWEVSTNVSYSAPGLSDALTRGGPIMGTAADYGTRLELESREGARTSWGAEVRFDRDEAGGYSSDIEFSVSTRPNDRLELSFDPEWTRERESRQYIATGSGGRAETFGNRYIFSAVDLSEIAARIRVNFTFTPNLTLETYAEPFAASGRFHGFGELLAPGSRELLLYGTSGTTLTRNPDGSHTVSDGSGSFDIENEDFNVRSFRSNMVLRWEWRAGSTLFVVWQQDREGDRPFHVARPGDLFDAFDTRGDNFLAIKLSYWLAID